MAVGNKASVSGSVTLGHNLQVKGWLDAPNLKTPCKGMFQTATKLKETYKQPQPGWYALVGLAFPAELWLVENGQWVDSGQTVEGPTVFVDAVDELADQVNDLRADTDELEAEREQRKDYPFELAASVDRTEGNVQWLMNRLRPAVITAEVVEHSTESEYRYDLAYIFRATDAFIAASTEPAWLKEYYNAVVLGRWSRKNPGAEPEFVLLRDYADIIRTGAGKFWVSYDWDGTTVRILIDAAALPADTALSFSNQSSSKLRGLKFIAEECYRFEAPPLPSPKGCGKQVVKVVGDELHVGCKFDAGHDILIWFRKCMNNDLMTFYRVGLAANTDREPNADPARDMAVVLNSARWSDNIGPLCIETSAGGVWTGANHLYTDNVTKSARTVSFEFRADGMPLKDGDLVAADVVTVRVVNHIFDPRVAPSAGATHLSKLLCVETVTYRIEHGDIQVSVNHNYAGATAGKVITYYGMQSMAEGETQLLTPQGAYASGWTAATQGMSFTKGAYPNFNRFIERMGDNMQLTLLYPDGIGDHRYVGTGEQVFRYGDSKGYHFLLRGFSFDASTRYSWRGLYSWMSGSVEVKDASGAMQALAYADRGDKRVYVEGGPTPALPEGEGVCVPLPAEACCRRLEVVSGADVVSVDDAAAGVLTVIGAGSAEVRWE